MLDFSDKAYRYFPPKPNRVVEVFLRWVNRRFYLRGSEHRIDEVAVENPEVIEQVRKRAK